MPPGTRNALVPPSPNYLQNAGQFVGGVGRGLSNQFVTGPLELVQQSYYDPYALGQGVVQGVAQFAQDPVGAVGNSLRSMWNRAKSSPAGLGEVVGENIDPRNWLKPRKALRKELDVYHGTPHTFEPEEGAPLGRFRSSKIGTGEGAQAYGYGLYLAEHPDVAKQYKVGVDLTPDELEAQLKYADYQAKNASTESARQGFANAAIELRKNKGKQGSVYKVDLPDAKIEQMLDWDKPLSEQSKSVQDALKSAGLYSPEITGDELHQKLFMAQRKAIGSNMGASVYQKAVANQLNNLGISGIKYLDAGSRAGEKGTRNFVVFPGEEQHLNILSRD